MFSNGPHAGNAYNKRLLAQALGCHCVRRGILQSLPVRCHFRGCKVPLFRIVSGAISSELVLPLPFEMDLIPADRSLKKLSCSNTELKRCTTNRNTLIQKDQRSRTLPETVDNRPPRSYSNWRASSHIGRRVSTANEQNIYCQVPVFRCLSRGSQFGCRPASSQSVQK